ncbi:MAG: YciI family protein [Lactobacillus sp.]|nr:YciI family protein [Lactobacillus sp.]
MYLIDITIKADKVPADLSEKLLAGHRKWFTGQAQAGKFLLVGPYKDKEMAGLAIAYTNSRAELDEIIAHDAYYPDYATYDVHEFQANLIADNLPDFQGK